MNDIASWVASTRTPKAISIEIERLATSGKLACNAGEKPVVGVGALRVVVGSGRGCMLHGHAIAPTVLVPLRGRMRCSDGESARTLRPGELVVAEGGQRLQAVGGAGALWIALVAPEAAWRQLFETTAEPALPEP
ncbi:MAG TPA: hypothetical protein VJ696_01385, partial [Rhodanobacteraceae bacterium]|nr:hypothetical protein [Rhodanobacteraceae bacterium]